MDVECTGRMFQRRSPHSTSRRVAGLLTAGILLGGVLPGPGPAVAESVSDLCHLPENEWPEQLTAPPVLCGKTTFRADGIAGFKVRVPEVSPSASIPLDKEHITITLQDGTFAFFGMADPTVCEIPEEWEMCFAPLGWLNPPFIEFQHLLGKNPPTLATGVYDLYVLSDGKVTLEFDVEGLTGQMDLKVDAVIDAHLDKLSRRCPATNCENIALGGLQRVNGEVGAAGSVAWAKVPSRIPPTELPNWVSSDGVVACVYPSTAYPTASPDPEDHPQGCDLVPNEHDLDSGINFVGSSADALAVGYEHFSLSPVGSGPRYAGYSAQQFSPLVEGGTHGAWGMWITKGVSCPSNNWFDCRV